MTSKEKKSFQMCRLCTMSVEVSVNNDLFVKSNMSFLRKIKDLTGITLKNMAGKKLPRHFCEKCQKDLSYAHAFRQKIIKTQTYFQSKDFQKIFSKINESSKQKNYKKQFENSNIALDINCFSVDNPEYEDNNTTVAECISPELSIKTERSESAEREIDISKYLNFENVQTCSISSCNFKEPNGLIKEETNNMTEAFSKGNISDNTIKNEDEQYAYTCFDTTESEDSSSEDIEELEIDPDFTYKQRKVDTTKEGNDKDLNLICYLCKNNFTAYSLFKIHWRQQHKGEKTMISCDSCDEKFKTIKSLKRHANSHKGEKAYKCHYCEESFQYTTKRSRHERRYHTKDWPFLCFICGKTFITTTDGRDHMAVHTKERAYRCEVCNAAFLQRAHLRNHYRSVTHKNNEIKLNEMHRIKQTEKNINDHKI